MSKTMYLHKYETSQAYGGPEEGGWWYDLRTPDPNWTVMEIHLTQKDKFGQWDDEPAYEICRKWNGSEYRRRSRENQYDYTSVLSYRDQFFTFDISDSPDPEPYTPRPYYE